MDTELFIMKGLAVSLGRNVLAKKKRLPRNKEEYEFMTYF